MKRYKDFIKENKDVFGEENWDEKELIYNGDIIGFLKELNNKDINNLLDDLLGSNNIDDRMDIADVILDIISWDHEEFYDDVEDDIRELV